MKKLLCAFAIFFMLSGAAFAQISGGQNMGAMPGFNFYGTSGNAAYLWFQPGAAPPALSDTFWFDNTGNFNVPNGANIPGPVSIGTTYLTANNLAELTADANFPGTVYLSSPVTLTANLTLTCDLRPLNGAVIMLGNYNLAVNGSFQGGLFQCFNVSGSGSVSFANTPPGGYLPEWWGATGNGGTDDTATCNLAKAAAESTHGTLVFTSGRTYALQQFQIDQGNWQVSAWGAKILHNGSTNSPVSGTNDLIVAGPSNIYSAGYLANFRWHGGILMAKQSTTNPTNALLWVGDIYFSTFEFEGIAGGNGWQPDPTTCYANYGIYIQGYGSGGSTGVYYDSFTPGLINGCLLAGVYIYDYQNHLYSNNLTFYHPRIQKCGIGIGGSTATGFDVNTGQGIYIFGGEAEDNAGVGINLESNSRDCHFYGFWAENNNGGISNGQLSMNDTSSFSSTFEGTISNSPGPALFKYFAHFLARTAEGTINYAGPTQVHLADQGACTMSSGVCAAQQLGGLYSNNPECFANWTGTGTLTGLIKLPTTGGNSGCTGSGTPYPCCTGSGAGTCYQVTPTSSVGTDTAQVDWFCVGN